MDLYVVLGVARGATVADVKRAYRRLARRYHPDINPGDRAAELRFRQITEAYETLSDPERRRRYDTLGEVAADGVDEPPAYGFEGFDFSVSIGGFDAATTFGDLFADVLRGRESARAGQTPDRGADLHQTLALTFDEAWQGGERTLTVLRRVSCPQCGGVGQVRAPEARCAQCHGTGAIRVRRGHMVFSRACEACEGSGRQPPRVCPACGGQGVQARSERVAIRIPSGVADGARLRVAEKGNVGRHGGGTGDLYVDVHVAAHPLFRREGDDIHLVVPVAIHEAGLGSRIDVPGPDGPVRVRIPPGTQSGQRFRLRERGAPSPREAGRRGDLVVEVRLVLPTVLDERSKELLRELGRINGEDVRKGLTQKETN
jgi:molecular chaperone DnaJ